MCYLIFVIDVAYHPPIIYLHVICIGIWLHLSHLYSKKK
nr:MAG TPA: hypothetical protein [Caudoviricetes sp.]